MSDLQILPDRERLVANAVIQHLAADEADLRARVTELEADVFTLREQVRAALDVAHDLTTERDELRRRYHAALDEARQLRADLRACQLGRAA